MSKLGKEMTEGGIPPSGDTISRGAETDFISLVARGTLPQLCVAAAPSRSFITVTSFLGGSSVSASLGTLLEKQILGLSLRLTEFEILGSVFQQVIFQVMEQLYFSR